MNARRPWMAAAAASLLLLLVGCRPPKYILYRAETGDFEFEAPYAWQVFFERSGDDYYNYTFLGPMDPDFFRGAPSLIIRWYGRNRPAPDPLGGTDYYRDADDYIEKTLKELYGPDLFLEQPVMSVTVSDLQAKHFVVAAPMPMAIGSHYGGSTDAEGNLMVLRKHAYVVIPMDNGFYVMIYPATQSGYNRYSDRFFKMGNSMKIIKDGPAGPVFH